ncbi:helix-turn-helix transcriptional regulator [Halonotius pteroides]|uniref:MarR family transcriptional regulator n=1 Tax=Halonotius pteroides TaxID=268735 RepID=A0A3A6Q869_9EURY|nr:MarR family transcriptional regulator [Halonotius pteroides]RJX47882.1 MarR family transcriptional regulator [Halonotius pteroides]
MSVGEPPVELSDSQQRGLELIEETGGIHQSEFWKELDVSSRTGSRIVDRLLEAELIERTETVYDGRKTYYLEPTKIDLDYRLLMAGDMLSPFIGEGDVDSQSDVFTQWVMNLQYEQE